jgi:hypothetical protein
MTATELQAAIERQKAHMKNREISHGMYYTDPYGQAADMKDLNSLRRQLAEVQGEAQ